MLWHFFKQGGVLYFHHAEKSIRAFVEINGIFTDTGFLQKLLELRPDVVMSSFIFFFEALVQLHLERSPHDCLFICSIVQMPWPRRRRRSACSRWISSGVRLRKR